MFMIRFFAILWVALTPFAMAERFPPMPQQGPTQTSTLTPLNLARMDVHSAAEVKGELFAASPQAQAVLRSSDFGKTWNPIKEPSKKRLLITALATHKDKLYLISNPAVAGRVTEQYAGGVYEYDPSTENIRVLLKNVLLKNIFFSDGWMIAHDDHGTFFRSHDDGKNWECIATKYGHDYVGVSLRVKDELWFGGGDHIVAINFLDKEPEERVVTGSSARTSMLAKVENGVLALSQDGFRYLETGKDAWVPVLMSGNSGHVDRATGELLLLQDNNRNTLFAPASEGKWLAGTKQIAQHTYSDGVIRSVTRTSSGSLLIANQMGLSAYLGPVEVTFAFKDMHKGRASVESTDGSIFRVTQDHTVKGVLPMGDTLRILPEAGTTVEAKNMTRDGDVYIVPLQAGKNVITFSAAEVPEE